ncbi:MAG: hypothetical protein WCI48_11205, partial [Bacteroidota bacterium]
MKKISFTLFLLVFAATCLYAQIDTRSTGAYKCYLKKSGMQELPKLPSQITTAGPHAYDVLKYTLDLDIYHCYTT